MHVILLVLGILCIAGGAGIVALATSDFAFADANTRIVAATATIVGGLLLIGLGSVVSHLRRIREALEAQRVLRNGGEMAPMQLAERVAALEKAPIPPVAFAGEKSASGPARPEPILPEAKVVPNSANQVEESAAAPAAEWPRVDAADRVASAQPSPDREAVEMPAMSHSGSPQPAAEPPQLVHPIVTAQEKSDATVLKSGVIEGMAYTLYSDGSIEAELAQGTMRFTSIPELRAYLRENPS